jgi:hypothetical protein
MENDPMTTQVLSASIDGNRGAAEPSEGRRSSGLHALEQWKAFRRICIAIAMLFFVKFAAFGLFLTPLWDVPDESGHYSYVEDLSHGRMPLLGETRISRDVTDSWKGPNARHRHRNWIAQHPPLYYALSAPVAFTIRAMGGSFQTQVHGVRVLNGLIGAVALVGLMGFLTLATGRGLLGLAGGILLGATPMFTQLSSGVTHDPLVACTAAWACYWLVRWLRDNLFQHALYCAFLAGMCTLAKAIGLTMAIPLFFSMALWILKSEGLPRWRRGVLRAGTVWLVMFLPILLWGVRNWLHFHQLFPDAGMLRVRPHNPNEMGFFEFMLEHPIWQNVVLNFVALLGWTGSVPGKTVTVQASGLVAQFFLVILLVCSSLSILQGVRFPHGSRWEQICMLMLVATSIALAATLPTPFVATITCATLLLAVALAGLRSVPAAIRGGLADPWLVLTSCICILFFSTLYYRHIWDAYTQTGTIRALHGRYAYGIMPFFALLMAWPLRKGMLPVAAIAVAALALVVSDGFFLHAAFVMYGII